VTGGAWKGGPGGVTGTGGTGNGAEGAGGVGGPDCTAGQTGMYVGFCWGAAGKG